MIVGILLFAFYSLSGVQLTQKYHYCEEKNYSEQYCNDVKKLKEVKELIHKE